MNRKNFIIYESANISDVQIKNEQNNGVRFIAILQEANKKNRNGRIYPKEVIQNALNHPIIQERLSSKTWFGEAGHPFSTEVSRQTTIDLNNVAFRIDRVWWEGDLLMGECLTTDTNVGRNMAGLIRQGSKLSFSLRANGKVTNDAFGNIVVSDPMTIICYDWVCTPSHQKSIITQICEETRTAWFGVGENMMSLQESAVFYEQGRMFEISDEQAEKIMIDYASNYGRTSKIYESYKYNKQDKIISLSDDGTKIVLESDDHLATVATDDYLRKALRNNVLHETKLQNKTGNKKTTGEIGRTIGLAYSMAHKNGKEPTGVDETIELARKIKNGDFNEPKSRVQKNQGLYKKREELLKQVQDGKMSEEEAVETLNKFKVHNEALSYVITEQLFDNIMNSGSEDKISKVRAAIENARKSGKSKLADELQKRLDNYEEGGK